MHQPGLSKVFNQKTFLKVWGVSSRGVTPLLKNIPNIKDVFILIDANSIMNILSCRISVNYTSYNQITQDI